MSSRKQNFSRGGGRRSRGGPSPSFRGRGAYDKSSWREEPQEKEFPAAAGGTPSVDPPPVVRGHPNIKREMKTNTSIPNLAPKALSTTSSAEKNDPLINEAILIDGISGFIERTRTRSFYNDFSQYLELVRTSYNSQITFDRSMRKYVSFGMYQYYSIIILWRRILYVVSQRGVHMQDYDQLVRFLNFDVPEPADLALYLNGVGDITDFSDRKFQFTLQAYPTPLQVNGAAGTFGMIGNMNAIHYETVPAPFVALEKIRQDYLFTTQEGVNRDWDLPQEVRPAIAAATAPTANLLGWSLSERLTTEQLNALDDAVLNDIGYGVQNIGNIPVNQNLMKYVAGMLENSKCKAIGAMSNTPTGSLAQIPYSVRAPNDVENNHLRPISAKGAQTFCYSQASSHIASGSACFRYRIQRRGPLLPMDTLCYRFDPDVGIPANWLIHEDDIFMAGAVNLWNTDQYALSEQDGSGLSTMISNRVRRKVTKE